MPEASMRKHIEINLVSTLIATQEVARLMVAGGRGGNIVNVASIEAFRAAPMFAVYSACKAGMVQFTRTMAVELAEHNIRVNCIAPDHTITPGMKGNRSGPVTPQTWETSGDAWAATIPAGREGVVAETSSTIIYLCSKMSEYVTGVTINVDGGTWASSGWHRDGHGGFILNP
jgi:NAD(P)-dependent dehydrogenase (short-subunit alcohol dehydrogenase family)